MYHIAICDDETRILEELKEKMESITIRLKIEATFYITDNPKDFIAYWEKNSVDFLFLDIDMPEISGMDLAKQLPLQEQKTLLVFVTNQDALVYEAFQFHPFAFIRKSYFDIEIENVVKGLVEAKEKEKESYIFRNGNEFVRIPFGEMIYFEAEANYVKLVTTTREYHYRDTLTNLTEALEVKGFLRIHKGFLVNQQYIYTVRINEVELLNHELLPIGRTNREWIRSQIMRYMR